MTRVLIVDDDRAMCEALSSELAEHGLLVEWRTTGAEAFERVVTEDIDVVVTLDAPLLGVSADKKIITDLVSCQKTYLSGAELVAARSDPATPALRAQQAAEMAGASIRLGTFGNTNDCLYNPAICAGGTWADDIPTQFLPGQAAVSKSYALQSGVLQSHDAINVGLDVAVDAVGPHGIEVFANVGGVEHGLAPITHRVIARFIAPAGGKENSAKVKQACDQAAARRRNSGRCPKRC